MCQLGKEGRSQQKYYVSELQGWVVNTKTSEKQMSLPFCASGTQQLYHLNNMDFSHSNLVPRKPQRCMFGASCTSYTKKTIWEKLENLNDSCRGFFFSHLQGLISRTPDCNGTVLESVLDCIEASRHRGMLFLGCFHMQVVEKSSSICSDSSR